VSERLPGVNEDLLDSALSARSPVLDVVAALLAHQKSSEGLRVLELSEHFATLVARSGNTVRVFRAPGPGRSDALRELIEQTLKHNPRGGSELVIVGGGAEDASKIESAVPKLLMHPFVVLHRDEAGEVRAWPAGKGAHRVEALRKTRKLDPDERRELLQNVSEHARSFHEERKERARFFKGMNTRPPRATVALLGAIGLMFALQMLWGPGQGAGRAEEYFYIAMGALYEPLIVDGQWYRMISVGFLHGGLMHVGMNSFVLYLLGSQMERVLGSVRFIVLYTAALLGGSFASTYFGHGFSVGASGAVWGLLGAQVALAYGRPPVLPKSVAESMKPLAKTNILINVGISFVPGIDAAAHFGGGLAGGLLLASGLLYRKCTRSRGEGDAPSSRPIKGLPAGLPLVAVLCVAVLIWGVAKALLEGQPWLFAEQMQALLQSR
jgi:membrane associated rhomboid family serine protease